MAKKFLSGNEAFAEGVRLARPQVISAYPITPQTIVVEKLSEMVEDGSLKSEFIHGIRALGAFLRHGRIGSRRQGVYRHLLPGAFVYGGMPDLRLRRPLPDPDDERQPFHRPALEHLRRPAGFHFPAGQRLDQAYAENAQEALDLALLGYYIAEKKEVSTPYMANLDGFVLTHTYEVVDVPTREQADAFLPPLKRITAWTWSIPGTWDSPPVQTTTPSSR